MERVPPVHHRVTVSRSTPSDSASCDESSRASGRTTPRRLPCARTDSFRRIATSASRQMSQNHKDGLRVTFTAFGKPYTLDLRMTKDLLPLSYFEKHHRNGSHVVERPMRKNNKHCYYHGSLEGRNDSWVAVSTCNGLSGVVYDGEELHYIHPDERGHLFLEASRMLPKPWKCGYDDTQSLWTSFHKRLYAPLNIFIALVGVIVWTDHDEIVMSSDGDSTLNNFLQYRRERLAREHPNDNAQLITDIVMDSSVVGKALKGPICTYEYSGGVNMADPDHCFQDHHQVVGVVATTMAHELGHNFGMEHDDKDSNSPPSPSQWSSCSKQYLQSAFEQGMDHCLWNLPDDIVGPVCGNGFLEAGEDCDCGPVEIKKAATLCRDAVTECDLPEYCDGTSEFCPVDVHVQDGTECGGGKAYCFRKQCRSHEDQCQLLWGPTGRMADQRCFERNDVGAVNANCGYVRLNKTNKKCHRDDVMCGMLQCVHLNERLEFGIESAAIQSKFFITDEKGRTFTCHSVIVDLGLFSQDPGQSPNGAKCGTNKACLNQKCVPLEKLYGVKCPYDCYNNGVSGYGFMVSMYIIFLCIVPLAAVTTFSIYYFRRHLKTWWMTKARKAAIKSRAQQTANRRGSRPLSKFNVDAEALKALEISPPLTQPSCPPVRQKSFRSADISRPVLQSTSNSRAAPSRPAPLRPAPARPSSVQRAPSCPAQGTGRPRVARSASQRSTGPRPAQPPPPRPPEGTLYDDCATSLQFAGTPLAFVHGEQSAPLYATPDRPAPTGVAALARRFECAGTSPTARGTAPQSELRPYNTSSSS
ncbi:zinc metalloproteinase, putative [Ixodes scapularis]|uniref:Zinc metalloproteinase, putative n=1 Tax=Ixodes scapularis TaxID=6945 RepID=B7P4M8_IXOSC|nr:zinc metalloproteinase, putative [Ixodes scapularis]|eukprot:XP_002406259.1 zinc metalloproteinase, putative [Ixodes scapularis]